MTKMQCLNSVIQIRSILLKITKKAQEYVCMCVCVYKSISLYYHIYVYVCVLLSHVWLFDPMDYTAHGILQVRKLEWVAYPFSRVSSQPRDRTQVSCIAGKFFTSWATREAQEY